MTGAISEFPNNLPALLDSPLVRVLHAALVVWVSGMMFLKLRLDFGAPVPMVGAAVVGLTVIAIGWLIRWTVAIPERQNDGGQP